MCNKDMKMYFLYTADGKEYIDTCIGIKELARVLGRTEMSVKQYLTKIKRKRIKYIDRNKKNLSKDINPTCLLLSEDDLRKGYGYNKPKKKGKSNGKKIQD